MNRRLFLLSCAALGGCAPMALQSPLTPETGFAGPSFDGDWFVSFDGARLGATSWPAVGETRVAVVALHGMNDYANAFHLAAPDWAGRGIATYAFDQRGFGRSVSRGIWAGRELMSEDLRVFVGLVKARHPGVPVVTYVNTSATVKAASDICCTSGNAKEVVESLGVPKVLMLPDEYLAQNVARQTHVELIAWKGHCEVHQLFTPQDIRDLREAYPGVIVLAHPECPPDVVLEAVGHETPFTQAIQAVRAGGTVSSVGVYVEPSMGFPAREAFFKDLTLRMGICNARNYIAPLLPLVRLGKLKPARIITHTLPLAEAPKGYAIFDRKEDRAIKVMLKP